MRLFCSFITFDRTFSHEHPKGFFSKNGKIAALSEEEEDMKDEEIHPPQKNSLGRRFPESMYDWNVATTKLVASLGQLKYGPRVLLVAAMA